MVSNKTHKIVDVELIPKKRTRIRPSKISQLSVIATLSMFCQ